MGDLLARLAAVPFLEPVRAVSVAPAVLRQACLATGLPAAEPQLLLEPGGLLGVLASVVPAPWAAEGEVLRPVVEALQVLRAVVHLPRRKAVSPELRRESAVAGLRPPAERVLERAGAAHQVPLDVAAQECWVGPEARASGLVTKSATRGIVPTIWSRTKRPGRPKTTEACPGQSSRNGGRQPLRKTDGPRETKFAGAVVESTKRSRS